jgi:hypothetical protein
MSLSWLTQLVSDVQVSEFKVQPYGKGACSRKEVKQFLQQHVQHAIPVETRRRYVRSKEHDADYVVVPGMSMPHLRCQVCREAVNWGFNRPVTYHTCEHSVCLSCAYQTTATNSSAPGALYCALCRQPANSVKVLFREASNTETTMYTVENTVEDTEPQGFAVLPPLDDSDDEDREI